MPLFSESEQKQFAAQTALKYIKSNMVVGLGSGSTAEKFIILLGEAVKKQSLKNLKVVSSSQNSAQLADELGLNVLPPETVEIIDINIDGTDETDINTGNSVKGGGNALHREKMIALKSKQNLFIAEEKKAVKQLGAFGLPVEIGTFDATATLKRIATLLETDDQVDFKMQANQKVMTDNQNYMVHIDFAGQTLSQPEKLYFQLQQIEGVFSVGLFLGLANKLIIGKANGETEEFGFKV